MRTTLIDRANFEYIADLEPVANPPGLYSLTIASRWRCAKDPDAERVKLDLLLDRDGLERLRKLIEKVCGQQP